MSVFQIVLIVVFLVLWLFVLGGMAINFRWLWFALTAKKGVRAPSGVILVFGLLGAVLAHFSIRFLKIGFGVDVPWPWLWIALPLILDPQGLVFLIFLLLRRGVGKGNGESR